MKLKILWGWLMVSGNYYLCPAQLFLVLQLTFLVEFINVKPNAESGCFSFYQLYATEYKITTKLSSFNTQCRQFNYTCTTQIRRWFTLHSIYSYLYTDFRWKDLLGRIFFILYNVDLVWLVHVYNLIYPYLVSLIELFSFEFRKNLFSLTIWRSL